MLGLHPEGAHHGNGPPLDRRARQRDRRGPPRSRLRHPHAGRPPPRARPLRRHRADRAARRVRERPRRPRRRARRPPDHAERVRDAERRRHPDPSTEVPDETGGPYPGDGSNGVNVLDDSGIVRSDIRSSFGSSTTIAEGVPLTIALTVRDAATRQRARRRGRLPLALRPRRRLLALQRRRRGRELPARGAGDRRDRHRDVHVDLSRPATRVAGRTSTSRCTRMSRTPSRRARS